MFQQNMSGGKESPGHALHVLQLSSHSLVLWSRWILQPVTSKSFWIRTCPSPALNVVTIRQQRGLPATGSGCVLSKFAACVTVLIIFMTALSTVMLITKCIQSTVLGERATQLQARFLKSLQQASQ